MFVGQATSDLDWDVIGVWVWDGRNRPVAAQYLSNPENLLWKAYQGC